MSFLCRTMTVLSLVVFALMALQQLPSAKAHFFHGLGGRGIGGFL
jgi:hypothetical protein